MLLGLGISICSTTFAIDGPRLGNGYDYNKYFGVLSVGKYYISDTNSTLNINTIERNSIENSTYNGYCNFRYDSSSKTLSFDKANCTNRSNITSKTISTSVVDILNIKFITPESIRTPATVQYLDTNGEQKIALLYTYYSSPNTYQCLDIHTIPSSAKPLNIIINNTYNDVNGGGNEKANGISYQSGDYIAFYHINSRTSCWTTVDTIDMNLSYYDNYIAGATIDSDGKIIGVVIGDKKQVLKAYDTNGNLYTKECNLNLGNTWFDLHKIRNPIYYIGKDYAYFVGYRTDVNELVEYKIDYDNCSITPIASSSKFDIFYGETKSANGTKVGVYALVNSGDLYYFDTSLNAHFLQSTSIINNGADTSNWQNQLTGVVKGLTASLNIKVDIQRSRFFCSYTTGIDMKQACIDACDTEEWQNYCVQCQTLGLPTVALSEFAAHCNINLSGTQNTYNTKDNIVVKSYSNSGVVIYTKDDITSCSMTDVNYNDCSLPEYNATGSYLDKIGYYVELAGKLSSYPLCQAGNLIINIRELLKSISKVGVVIFGDVEGVDSQILKSIGNVGYYNFLIGNGEPDSNASKMQAITIQYTLTLIHIVDIIIALIILIAIGYYLYTKYKK